MKRYLLGLAALAVFSVALVNPTNAEARGAHGHRAAVHHRAGYNRGRYHYNYGRPGYRWYWNTSYRCY